MSLFHKLFNNRDDPHFIKNDHNNASDKLFAFSSDQVRIVLFRECDFRGRKLLFDSQAIEKVSISNGIAQTQQFKEISNGIGYLYSKVHSDCGHLAEMIFGSVAMSFRGTYFKIHNLSSPQSLMFTQVFPSPRHSKGRVKSCTSRNNFNTSTQSLEHSLKLDDSGASSGTSISEQLSVYSTASDTVLVCKQSHNNSLGVPSEISSAYHSKDRIGDSGCAEPFSSSFLSLDNSGISAASLSSGNWSKRFLRSFSASLDQSTLSLNHGNTNGDECFAKPHPRSSKLGLAIILRLNTEEEHMTQFLMEHITILQSMVWKIIHTIQLVYNRPTIFLSSLVDISEIATSWLVSFMTGPVTGYNIWSLLSSGCENHNSINIFNADFPRALSNRVLEGLPTVQTFCTLSSSFCSTDKVQFNFSYLSKFFKTEWDIFTRRKELDVDSVEHNIHIMGEKFLREFCETLETVDIKDTNFFVSTLLTAVLTHHLGWVNTCLPQTTDMTPSFHPPYNCLWGQLSDLYGAVGTPMKMAQTIITGSNKNDIINKMLNCLTYFIRCTNVERSNTCRANINDENKIVDEICLNSSLFIKEKFKSYQDHLRDIMTTKWIDMGQKTAFKCEKPFVAKKSSEVKNVTLKRNTTSKQICNDVTPSLDTTFNKTDLNHNNTTLSVAEENDVKNKVLFVLGDNEELVNLKNNSLKESNQSIKDTESKPITPTNFNSSELNPNKSFKTEQSLQNFQDSNFSKCDLSPSIQPSTSWTSSSNCTIKKKVSTVKKEEVIVKNSEKPFVRSQSVPPEDCSKPNSSTDKIKTKFRYSGVKFNLQQYPQIVKNYMKSKNLELANYPLEQKIWKLNNEGNSITNNFRLEFPEYESDSEEVEALQTPSNASELEFTSDLFTELPKIQHAVESNVALTAKTSFVKKPLSNAIVMEHLGDGKKMPKRVATPDKTDDKNVIDASTCQKMDVINLPMPKTLKSCDSIRYVPYTSSVMKGVVDKYMPNMVLQGLTVPKIQWQHELKNDLSLNTQHSLLDQPIEEAVAIIANTDTWEVQLVTSHTYVIDKSGSGAIRIGMSQLVANMLESLLQMWKLHVPTQYCLMHIEQTLQELCLRSKALAQFLLASEFCSMELLTSALHLEENDVPLLMAVASTHTPQVTQKYGISFNDFVK